MIGYDDFPIKFYLSKQVAGWICIKGHRLLTVDPFIYLIISDPLALKSTHKLIIFLMDVSRPDLSPALPNDLLTRKLNPLTWIALVLWNETSQIEGGSDRSTNVHLLLPTVFSILISEEPLLKHCGSSLFDTLGCTALGNPFRLGSL